MNREIYVANELKRMYGFSSPFDELPAFAESALVAAQRPGSVDFVPALDALVDRVREGSGRARRAHIDTVTETVIHLLGRVNRGET